MQDGTTAVMLASLCGHVETVVTLKDAGADLNMKTSAKVYT